MQFAEIAITVPVRGNQTFHYRVPENLAEEIFQFSRVEVPFSGRSIQGFVIDFNSPPNLTNIKDIKRVVEKQPFLNEDLLKLAHWMVKRYLCGLGDALHCIAGSTSGRNGLIKKQQLIIAASEMAETGLARAPKQRKALEVALSRPGMEKADLARAAGVSLQVINTMLNKGLLKLITPETKTEEPRKSVPLTLTSEQDHALKKLREAMLDHKPSAWLLHGVTGSGKTEVYLQAIAENMDRGKQSIILVPEISLTPQMVERFKARFGDAVAVLHSSMSQGERYAEKIKIRCGLAPVILGARSAIFAPTEKLGLIIIDEEHETSYKQDENPKYHAREVALRRAAQSGAVVLLGSATPALESFCRAREGGPYRLISLSKRIDNRQLPQVQIVDLREELSRGNIGIFSSTLISALANRLEKGEKSILFLNRRGLNTSVICRQCGQVMKCHRCDISLTLHNNNRLKCHYCGYGISSPTKCPTCDSKFIRGFGVGTQKVEEEVRKIFPTCKLLRMDADTTSRKGSHKEILNQFIHGEGQILIGTQMIAKGLDIPEVTLVGVVSADLSLNVPDFRSAERTFQLLTQVAGRAGRGKISGDVVIQTYDPEHFSILTAKDHDFNSFFRREMAVRKALCYPPFSHLIRVLFSGSNEADVIAAAQWWQESLLAVRNETESKGIEVLGPAPAGIPKIKERYRWQLIIKGPVSTEIRKVAGTVLEKAGIRFKQVTVSIDVDPLSL